MRSNLRTALLGLIVSLCAAPSNARADDDRWHFSITPYLWLPSTDSSNRVDRIPVEVDNTTSAFDTIGNLDFVLMVAGEARKDKIGIIYNVQAIKVSEDGSVNLLGKRDFDSDVTLVVGGVAGEYRIVDDPKFSLDVLAGARFYYADLSIRIDSLAGNPRLSSDQSETWVEPIVGGKFAWHLNKSWAILGYDDIGGFGAGSDLSYQAIGAISYSINEHLAVKPAIVSSRWIWSAATSSSTCCCMARWWG